nr:S8 family peptidase [Clostridium aminobutyricum]
MHVQNPYTDRCAFKNYPYYAFQSLFFPESIISLRKIDVLHYLTRLDFDYSGQDVLVGIVDSGIEYQHQAFLNIDNTSRIISIWDQTINDGGNPPEGYNYGTEYTKQMLNLALQDPYPLSVVPTTDELGYGTMLAGIIAGNENPKENFCGVVPKAELVVVKLKQAKQLNRDVFLVPPDEVCYQDSDIMLGISYAISVAEKLKRPLVLCVALGSNKGGHDGHGALSTYLTLITQRPRMAVVISAGNEGNQRRHYQGNIMENQGFTRFNLKVSEQDKGFSIELWTTAPGQVAIDITSPTGEYISELSMGIMQCAEHTLDEKTVVWINNLMADGETGDQVIWVRFLNPREGNWKFRVYNKMYIQTRFNVWLPGDHFISNETYFLNSCPNVTITSPGNSQEPMTITAYDPDSGELADFSSLGYSRTNFVKPDLAAPGVNMICPTLGNSYGSASGTGAAAAYASGVVAMVLEWAVIKGHNTDIKGYDIKKLLIQSAQRNMYMKYPNPKWGYGKIDLMGLHRLLK